jgi:aminoglycoside phosphotransferase (APT) family kinase protein
MHDGQVDVDVDIVRRLLAEQIPGLTGLPITNVVSTGTVNALFRIGDDLVGRFPLTPDWSDDVDREWRLLPWLSQRITAVRLPEPVHRGAPDEVYPFSWSVYRWIDGSPYADELVADEAEAARTLARVVLELRSIDVHGDAPAAGRDPLLDLDDDTREAIRGADGVIDADAATHVWEDALTTPPWNGDHAWIHSDLLRPNILVDDGRLVAVIDFGGAGVGDPATDLTAAWATFGTTGRAAYREALRRCVGARSRHRAAPSGDDHPVLRRDEPGVRRPCASHDRADPRRCAMTSRPSRAWPSRGPARSRRRPPRHGNRRRRRPPCRTPR